MGKFCGGVDRKRRGMQVTSKGWMRVRAFAAPFFRVTAHREWAGSGGDSREEEKVSRVRECARSEMTDKEASRDRTAWDRNERNRRGLEMNALCLWVI